MKKLQYLFLCCFLAIIVTTVEAGNPSDIKKKVTLKTNPYKALEGTKRSPILPMEDSIHKEVNLKEVRVEANNVNMHPDHTTYMPTQQQKNAANSGVGLLYNLMIPQLTVD